MDGLNVAPDILVGTGEMAERIRSFDWSRTSLGPVENWPQSLVTAVNIILDAHYPMLIEWGPDFIQIYNDAYRPVLGASKHPGALGQPARECWPEIWDYLGPAFERALDKGKATWEEDQLFLLNRNGYLEETYFTFCYSAIRDESRHPGGVLVTCIETTERVLGERRLRTLRELAGQAGQAQSAEDACLTAARTLAGNPYDIPFALLYQLDGQNSGSLRARLVGLAGLRQGGVASPVEVSLAEDERGETSTRWPLARAAQTLRIVEVENIQEQYEGLPGGPWPESPTRALVFPIAQLSDVVPDALLVVGINPRRALDDDYRGFLDLVRSHIATSIANAQAHEAERRRAEALAELDRAKTEFFSNVSHEFRTPLTLLLGPLQDSLAELSPSASPQRERLEIAYRNAQRLLKLVNTLLDFSRIEAGRIEAVYAPADLAALTADLASTFRSAIERAGLRFVVDCPPLPEPIYVDEQMWEKIVLNLLSNAFKFTFNGEIAVSLEQQGDQVVLTVRDSGVGIPPDEIPHVFERFYRVQSACARTQEGTGIGLALVQELVRLHGGAITLESEVGKGTTFRVSLLLGKSHLPADQVGAPRTRPSTAIGATPFVEEALRWLPVTSGDKPARMESGERREAPTEPTSGPKALPSLQADSHLARVLVVDDNADMRLYLAHLLGERWAVEAVADGDTALRVIAENPPDLVLSDVMMPGLDGFQLLQSVRSDPNTRAIPFILLSARAGEEATVEGIAAGADDYLVKPFGARELSARVGTHLELARMRRVVEAVRRRDAFLAEASRILASSLDYQATLRCIAQLTVPFLADWCIVDVIDRQGQMQRVGAAATDPEKGRVLEELQRRYPPKWPSLRGLSRVALRGEAQLISEVTTIDVASYARDAEHLHLLSALAPTSFMAVPLVAHARTIGVISLASAESGRHYGPDDLALAKDLANRCALALDNARLYADSQEQVDVQTQLNTALRELAETRERMLALANAERELLQTVFEQAPAFIAILRGPTHVFEVVNPPYEQLAGRRREDLVGRPVRHALPEVEGQGYFEILDRVYITGEPFVGNEMEVKLNRNGTLDDVFLNFIYHPLRNADGEVDGIVAFGFEVTEQVNARRALEATMRQRDALFAIVSHDLKNPLTGIQGTTEMLQRYVARTASPDVERVQRALATIASATVRMRRQINELVDLARVEAGQPLSLERTPTDLVALTREVIVAQQQTTVDHQLRLETALQELTGEWDPDRLQRVVNNLVENAIKYSPNGGLVTVSVEKESDPCGEWAVLQVRDEGIGIPAENLPQIFERFYRAGNVSEIAGSGIGLASVRQIVEQHGGTITVATTPGIGSTFTVRLPLGPSPGHAD